MGVAINYWAVLAAGAASMIVGAVWYAPAVFGKTWARLAGLSMDRKVKASEMTNLMFVQFIVSLLTAYVLAHFMFFVHYFTQDSWIMDSVNTALWAWLGFTACRLVTHDMFEGRRKKLTLLNCAHEVVTLVAMALVLGVLHP
jgi:hypothetical protein